MGKYKLYCPGCKITFDDAFNNVCPCCGNSGPLIKAVYEQKEFQPLPLDSFWKFQAWLPCLGWNDMIRSQTIVYKSEGFASELGLKNLYIAFNGYWPERGANMITCTFKELESPPTFQRAVEKCITNLVIASAGNTARAFIWAAQFFDIDLFVVVPQKNLYKLVLPFEVPDNVNIIAVNHSSDYTDSIIFSGRMSTELNLVSEGGARNVARRDGMGTVFLEAVHNLGQIPKHYFQAVGSGTGAIATLEAAQRLIESGQFSSNLPPKLHLAQNKPFTPLVDAWNKGLKEIIAQPEEQQRKAIADVYAEVLTNRHPPYSVGGGVYEILTETSGFMYGVTNDQAKSIGKLFESSEEIDLVPAACVAVGALVQAIETDQISPDDTILLNIAGGGEKRLWDDFSQIKVEPDIICDDTADMNELKLILEAVHDRE